MFKSVATKRGRVQISDDGIHHAVHDPRIDCSYSMGQICSWNKT